MRRPWSLLASCLLVGAALAFTCLRSSGGANGVLDSVSGNHGFTMTDDKGAVPGMLVITNRKLKENRYGTNKPTYTLDLEAIDVEDYPRFNQTPSTETAKASPIEHGTPLMPYIPLPRPMPPAKPPSHPKHGSP